MIIDCNANLGNWPFRRLRYNQPDTLLERLARVDITHAWVTSLDAVLLRDCHTANAPLMEATSDHDALMPVATINPEFPGWERDLAQCVDSLGYRGLRTYPNYHCYPLDHPAFDDLLAAAADLGIFVSIAVHMTDERHHHPLCMVKPTSLKPLPRLAAKYPGLPIIIANASGASLHPVVEPTRDLPNILFEISRFESAGGMETLGRALGIERLLFGTFAPYYYPESAVLQLMQECAFSQEELSAITSGNAQRLMASLGKGPD